MLKPRSIPLARKSYFKPYAQGGRSTNLLFSFGKHRLEKNKTSCVCIVHDLKFPWSHGRAQLFTSVSRIRCAPRRASPFLESFRVGSDLPDAVYIFYSALPRHGRFLHAYIHACNRYTCTVRRSSRGNVKLEKTYGKPRSARLALVLAFSGLLRDIAISPVLRPPRCSGSGSSICLD